jgi:hypothetical protein
MLRAMSTLDTRAHGTEVNIALHSQFNYIRLNYRFDIDGTLPFPKYHRALSRCSSIFCGHSTMLNVLPFCKRFERTEAYFSWARADGTRSTTSAQQTGESGEWRSRVNACMFQCLKAPLKRTAAAQCCIILLQWRMAMHTYVAHSGRG